MTDQADERWASERRSGAMSWFRRRFGFMHGIAGAVSHADTGPYAGAPRNPDLRVDDEKTYSTISYATNQQVTYTSTGTGEQQCPECGRPLAEDHEIVYVEKDDSRVPVGAVKTCRGCHPDSWLRRSQMPTASQARIRSRKNVV